MKKALKITGVALVAAFLVVVFCLIAPTRGNLGRNNTSTGSASEHAATEARVASLKGPTSIGLVKFMDDASNGLTYNTYTFDIAGADQPDTVLASMLQGKTDIALMPANMASVLYNKTNGAVSVIDINTLGVLYVVSGDSSIHSLSDLSGRTVYMTGKGATPEYVMNYLLDSNGLSGQVNLEYKSEATEVAALIAQDANAIAVLPEPYVTSVTSKNPSINSCISLNDEWNKLSDSGGGQMVTGVTVVRNSFLEEHPEAVSEFVSEHSMSVANVNADPAAAAPLVVEKGIIDNEAIAKKAIPACNLVCYSGKQMKNMLSGYLQVLYEQNPTSVGGALPKDDFYLQ